MKRSSFIYIAVLCLIVALAAGAVVVTAQSGSFQKAHPNFVEGDCCATDTGVRLKWRVVKGADEYQVVRAEEEDGEYSEFAVTENLNIHRKTDGDGFYKVRALRGNQASGWSRVIHIRQISGKLTGMEYDENGHTCFCLTVTNRSKEPVYFYGQGMYIDNEFASPLYQFREFSRVSGERTGEPYPQAGWLRCEMNKSIECAPNGQTEIELIFPQHHARHGSNGTGNELFFYSVEAAFFAGDLSAQPQVLKATDQEAESEASGLLTVFHSR